MADDDRESRVKALSGALLVAMIRSNGLVSAEVVVPIAEQLDALGVRTTTDIDEEALAEVPGFVKQEARDKAAPTPVEPNHQAIQDTPRVRKAPKPPKRIPKDRLGVVG